MGRLDRKTMGLDFMQQVPVYSFIVGVVIALVCNQFWQPVDEVLMIIAGLLTLKAALCLIPETPQRYAPDGKPYIRHRKKPEDALVECVIGFGTAAFSSGYSMAITFTAEATLLAIHRNKLCED